MNTTILKCLVPALMLGAAVAPAMAQSPYHHPVITHRDRDQNKRIYQGVHSGQLTRREDNHLDAREYRIHRAEVRDIHSGGHFTAAERANIRHRLARTSHAIYRDKHNRHHD